MRTRRWKRWKDDSDGRSEVKQTRGVGKEVRKREASKSETIRKPFIIFEFIVYSAVLHIFDWRSMISHFKKLRHGMYLPTPQERMRCINLDISSFDDDQGQASQETVSSPLVGSESVCFNNLFSVTAVSYGSVNFNDVGHNHYSQLENVDTKEGFYSEWGTSRRKSWVTASRSGFHPLSHNNNIEPQTFPSLSNIAIAGRLFLCLYKFHLVFARQGFLSLGWQLLSTDCSPVYLSSVFC